MYLNRRVFVMKKDNSTQTHYKNTPIEIYLKPKVTCHFLLMNNFVSTSVWLQ